MKFPLYRSALALGLTSVLAAHQVLAQSGAARLTVRHSMATGTTNPAAGEYPLNAPGDMIVTVPSQCAGAHRCPLFLMLPGGGIPARQMTDWLGPVAQKYGYILLTATEYEPEQIDSAMKETFARFAIDTTKIAVVGRCASGGAGVQLGTDNLDVFNRIASVSGAIPLEGLDPNNKTAQFLVDRGFLEANGSFQAAEELRKGGHPVTQVLALRGHEHQMEDYDFVGHWLQQSWAKPDPATRPKPQVVADPLPALSSDVMTKMTTFWTSFAQEPDSIRVTARRATLHEVVVPVGTAKPIIWMSDMVALAKKYPSVAADLKKAGMTAEQEQAYRVALISAQVSKSTGDEPGAPEANSVAAKNLEFLNGHLDEFRTLREAGIAHPDQVAIVRQTATITHPKLAEEMGAMGIWRTP
jgi:hypothetical protein